MFSATCSFINQQHHQEHGRLRAPAAVTSIPVSIDSAAFKWCVSTTKNFRVVGLEVVGFGVTTADNGIETMSKRVLPWRQIRPKPHPESKEEDLMMMKEEEIKEHLMSANPEFRQLVEEHKLHEGR